MLWWVAFALALRSFFEPVMVSYYPWPPMAVALIPAATLGWRRLLAAGLLAGALTGAAQGPSHDYWIWWAPIVAASSCCSSSPGRAGRLDPRPERQGSRAAGRPGYMRMGGETGAARGA